MTTPWDNPTVDGLLWAAAVVLLVVVLVRWGPRLVPRDDDLYEPLPEPVPEPPRHARTINLGGGVLEVTGEVDDTQWSEMEDRLHLSIYGTYRGQLGHTPFCRSEDGTELTCECEETA